MTVCGRILLGMRNVSDKIYFENQKTHFMFSNFFIRNRPFYKVMLSNMLQPDRPQIAK